jgi:hypothetical protein
MCSCTCDHMGNYKNVGANKEQQASSVESPYSSRRLNTSGFPLLFTVPPDCLLFSFSSSQEAAATCLKLMSVRLLETQARDSFLLPRPFRLPHTRELGGGGMHICSHVYKLRDDVDSCVVQ